MKLKLGSEIHEVETVVACDSGIFSEQPDKVGSVRIFGGDGRVILAMIEQARMLYDEYPEECVKLLSTDEVTVAENGRERLADITVIVAKGEGSTLLASSLNPDATHNALVRLQRYATRLIG